MDTLRCVLVWMPLLMICHGLPANKNDVDDDTASGCRKYDYCRAESFERRVDVFNYRVLCETDNVSEKYLRENCCLANERHLVCYDLVVDGNELNYSNDTTQSLVTTDFSDLCDHMVRAVGKKPGYYNSATFADGGGEIAFLYGVWKDVDTPSERHIRHLACGIADD